jgi:hypothetical protein
VMVYLVYSYLIKTKKIKELAIFQILSYLDSGCVKVNNIPPPPPVLLIIILTVHLSLFLMISTCYPLFFF